MDDATPERKRCRICGHPLDRKNRTGLCGNRTPACRRARDHLTAEQKPGKFRVVINPGDTFGRWTVLEAYSMENRRVLCRCTCGTERRVDGIALTNKHSLSCGICVRTGPRLPKEPYLTAGQVFGRLTVLEDAMYSADRIRCRCECESGTEVSLKAAAVKNGQTRSCGCLLRELRFKHGFAGHPLYDIWKGVMGRCTDPDNAAYANYGGRGITICDRWRDVSAFIADIEREIGPRPEGVGAAGRALYSLDRWPDNNGNYEPGNVRWATAEEQVANQRKVSMLTQDVLRLTKERDALAAELATLRALLPFRRREAAASAMEMDALFLESDIP